MCYNFVYICFVAVSFIQFFRIGNSWKYFALTLSDAAFCNDTVSFGPSEVLRPGSQEAPLLS